MRLIECTDPTTLRLVERFGNDVPPYAILSHTWGQEHEEVSYSDMVNAIGRNKPGYKKIDFCVNRARLDKLDYVWLDTCCIDKTNSVELSEAISSMFDWYRRSTRCYVYLSDVSSHINFGTLPCTLFSVGYVNPALEAVLRPSLWFTRGWTLQELIAPGCVQFFFNDGSIIGTKGQLISLIHNVTGIDCRALCGYPLVGFGIDERFKWAEGRRTKRPEDEAYSLLGLFGVRMRPDYGEGRELAFDRLRRKIDKLQAAKSPGPRSNSFLHTSRDIFPFHFRVVTVHVTRHRARSWVDTGFWEFDLRYCSPKTVFLTSNAERSHMRDAVGYQEAYARLQSQVDLLTWKLVYWQAGLPDGYSSLPRVLRAPYQAISLWGSIFGGLPGIDRLSQFDFILERRNHRGQCIKRNLEELR